jgi:hypothetical protein
LDLGHVVKGYSSIDRLPGNGQGFGLSEQSAFVVGSAGHGRPKLNEGSLEMPQSQQNAAQTRVRQST